VCHDDPSPQDRRLYHQYQGDRYFYAGRSLNVFVLALGHLSKLPIDPDSDCNRVSYRIFHKQRLQTAGERSG
jgi:hypothetical protein